MTRYLLLATLGPVQDFIAQARRTRDLWFGSHLLSEVGRAAARDLAQRGAALVFPALTHGDTELDACPGPLRIQKGQPPRPPVSIPNKILAYVELDGTPAANAAHLDGLLRSARDAAIRCLAEAGDRVFRDCAGLIVTVPGVRSVWHEQIATLIEFVGAWAPFGTGELAYRDARRTLEAAVAGRKMLRDFGQWQHQRGGVPKSSLDGARETVLREPTDRDPGRVAKYRVSDGEQLDAVGLVKRAGGEPRQFVPIANVALAAWIEEARQQATAATNQLEAACQTAGIGAIDRPDITWTRAFGYDAQVLLEDRWNTTLAEAGYEGDGRAWGRAHARPVLQAMKSPYPYVACLAADGDKMGSALDQLREPAAHQRFSQELSRFAADARQVVEANHRGLLIYAGGDDVLAFVCLVDALACAEQLRQLFCRRMECALPQADATSRPTLSVGIGVGHLLESMGSLLELGRRAERLAKGAALAAGGLDRNALGIVVDKRAGGTRQWRDRWTAPPNGAAERLRGDASLLATRLSRKKVYEIERALAVLPLPGAVPSVEDQEWAGVVTREVTGILARTGRDEEVLRPDDVGLPLLPAARYDQQRAAVRGWVDRVLVARVFAEASAAAAPRRTGSR